MTALVDDLQIRLMTGHDAHQYIRLVMLAKVRAKTTLSALNHFHLAILLLTFGFRKCAAGSFGICCKSTSP
jgi:hypothetical protein